MDLRSFQSLYGLSNDEAARFFGCSRSTVQKWRSGAIEIPRVVQDYTELVHRLSCCRKEVFQRVRDGSFDATCGDEEAPEAVNGRGFCDWIGQSPRVFSWIWFPDSTLVCVSKNFEDAIGVPVGELEGRRWLDFVASPFERVEAEKFLRSCVHREKTVLPNLRLVLPGDRPASFLIHGLYPGNTDERGAFASLLVDVTEEESAKKKVIALHRTLESVHGEDPEPILVFSGDGRFLSANVRMRRLLGKVADGNAVEDVFTLLAGAEAREEIKRVLEELPGEGTVPVSVAAKVLPGGGARSIHGRLRRCYWKGERGFVFSLGVGWGSGSARSGKRLAERRLAAGPGVLIRSSERFPHVYLKDDDQTWHQVELLGRLHGAMRAYVFEYDQETDALSNTVEWCSEGVEPQVDSLQQHRFSADTPWWFGRMVRGEPVLAPVVADLPPEAAMEKEILEAQDVRGLAAYPLWEQGRLSGFVGLDFSRTFERFDEEMLGDLRNCAAAIREKRRLLCAASDQSEKLSHVSRFFHDAKIAVYRWEPAGDIATVSIDSADLLRLPGGSRSELTEAKSWLLRHIHPDDRPAVEEGLARFVAPGAKETRFLYRFTHDFEDFVELEHRLFVEERDERGIPITVIAFLRPQVHAVPQGPSIERSHDKDLNFVARLAHDLKTPLHLLETLRTDAEHSGSDALTQEVLAEHKRQIEEIIELADGLANPEVPALESVDLGELADEVEGFLKSDRDVDEPSVFLDTGVPAAVLLQRSWFVDAIRQLSLICADWTVSGLRSVCISFQPEDDKTGILSAVFKADWTEGFEDLLRSLKTEWPLSLPGSGSSPRFELAFLRLNWIGGRIESSHRTLSIRVPCEATRWLEEGSRPETNSRRASVLLVEDHDLIRKVTLRQLEMAGFRVASVGNGREALQWLEKNPVDLVLLDLQMPVMNGFQFLDRYMMPEFAPHRARHGIFVLSALEGKKLLDELSQYPVRGFLSKPFSVKSLIETLEEREVTEVTK